MNKPVATIRVYSPRYIFKSAKLGQHWTTAAKCISRCWSTTTNYIRFQWAFRHPRNWRRYTPVTRLERTRNKLDRRHDEEINRWHELWLSDQEAKEAKREKEGRSA